MKKLFSIQALRAFAILIILYTGTLDFAKTFGKSHQQQLFSFRYFGYMGLDIFMVIAGFMAGYAFYQYNGKKDGLEFLKNRFLRVNIVYYAGAIIYLVLICFLHPHYPKVMVTAGLRDMLIPLRIIDQQQQFFLMLEDSWSFSFLWYFYLLFAATIFFKIEKKLLVLGVLLIILSIIGFFVTPYFDFRSKFYTSPIMLEFLAGLFVYWLYREQKISKTVAIVFVILAIGAYIYNLFLGNKDFFKSKGDLDQIFELKRVLMLGLPAVLLVAGSIVLEQKGILSGLWNNKFLQLTGNASFSIFLIYPTVFFLITISYLKLGISINPDLLILLHYPIAYAIGILFHKKVELPLLSFIEFKPRLYANA
ncbi:acyltransferase [Chitinophaga silvatica]|uniref:Acyltransferase n=1 Tax=Chitinophaga silvatica TaxID=2282649 RepID=A0A3E1YAN7_9BACT|nr:acyltransferase family protein [Chitinophaga silvatica]RFS22728.1 acyltransferase [Chitinophaga silvatica]